MRKEAANHLYLICPCETWMPHSASVVAVHQAQASGMEGRAPSPPLQLPTAIVCRSRSQLHSLLHLQHAGSPFSSAPRLHLPLLPLPLPHSP